MTDPDLLVDLGLFAAVILGAVLVHVAVFRTLFRFGWRSETARRIEAGLRWPARTLTALVVALVALPLADLDPDLRSAGAQLVVVAIIGALAWSATRGVRVFEDTVLDRLDVGARDNLYARRRLTQVVVIRRVATVVITVLAVAAALLTFDSARSVGASVLASAGVIGLLAGIAAQATLGNFVAGLQIAFAEPIRLDDVVVVEGEWGNIEEITLTYVVVRIWDRRRLVLPTSYFLEQPFENWTRQRAQVIGSVVLHLDYRAPIDDLRAELQRAVEASDRWDGEVLVLQVIESTESTIVVRALMSAEDAATAWDLRCEVRERLVAWLREHHPEALPVTRIEVPPRGEREPSPEAGRADGGRQADAHLGDAFPQEPEDVEIGAFRAHRAD